MIIVDALLLLVAVAIVIGGASLVASLKASGTPKKRKLAAYQTLVNEIENSCLDQIAVDPQDLTAHRVAGLIRKSRQKELM